MITMEMKKVFKSQAPMKSFVKVFGVVAGMAALLVSCNKQEEVFVPEDKTVEMPIVAS